MGGNAAEKGQASIGPTQVARDACAEEEVQQYVAGHAYADRWVEPEVARDTLRWDTQTRFSKMCYRQGGDLFVTHFLHVPVQDVFGDPCFDPSMQAHCSTSSSGRALPSTYLSMYSLGMPGGPAVLGTLWRGGGKMGSTSRGGSPEIWSASAS